MISRSRQPESKGADLVRSAVTFMGVSLVFCAAAFGSGPADSVVIVANSDAPGSLAIAQHYASVRGVPPANIISLKMPAAETITWKEFVGSLWQPVQDRLVKEGWIDAIAMDLVDDVGRRKYAISGHKISALILCRGVSLRIENDPALFKDVVGLTDHPELRTNQAAVDSELSLLAQTNSPINASLPNPLFNNPRPTELALAQVVKVCRLDGPTVADAMGLVDLAITAERSGLLGRAYVDIAGPHENGNRWLETTASEISALGYDLTVAHGPQTMSAASRIDAPALYFGWYTPDLNGPFALPGFRFPPGAVAVHVHSYSAHTLRSTTEGWCGPLIARGATATVGNVYEPYLEFLHRPDLLMEALARGDDLVDAAYFALPVLSWQSIVIGDPLYRPFAKGLDAQTSNLASLPPPLAGYAVLRRMNLLDVAGKRPEAILLGKEAMKASPNLALALALAQRLQSVGNGEDAAWMIKGAAENADLPAANWELMRESAAFLADHQRPGEAVDIYRTLFAVDPIPASVRLPWLAEARATALAAGDTGQAAEWKEEIERAAENPAATNP